MSLIEQRYQQKCATPSDIAEHLPTLRRYASQCQHVTELGVRTVVSTWAFLAGLREPAVDRTSPIRTLISVDLAAPPAHGGNLDEVYEAAKRAVLHFRFIEADDRKIALEPTDLLFIDTWHVEEQLRIELQLHAEQARKWIILHDTETFGVVGETLGHRGLLPALTDFLEGHPEWKVVERFTNCNGLMVLERRPQ